MGRGHRRDLAAAVTGSLKRGVADVAFGGVGDHEDLLRRLVRAAIGSAPRRRRCASAWSARCGTAGLAPGGRRPAS